MGITELNLQKWVSKVNKSRYIAKYPTMTLYMKFNMIKLDYFVAILVGIHPFLMCV